MNVSSAPVTFPVRRSATMKRQYLGDSKDCFKWDYLGFLVQSLGLPQLRVVWMMTPDDGTSEGSTLPTLFPGRPSVVELCENLRATRAPELVAELPGAVDGNFEVHFHQPYALSVDRRTYFSGITCSLPSVVFLDPDNGFEPSGARSDKHVRYAEVDDLIQSLPSGSIVTVFQHFRRKRFIDDFAVIRSRLLSGHSCAIYWHSLMFVTLSACAETLARVIGANSEYAKSRPVKTVA